jgi:type I restriction enzyme S subunit
LREHAEIRTGIAKNSKLAFSNPITVKYLRVANVQDGFLDLADMKTIQIQSSDLERYRLLAGDVLMNEGGDIDKLGRGAVWKGLDEPCVHQNHVFVVRCKPSISSAFLNAWTRSTLARRYFMFAGKQTTNLASINKTQLGRLPVAVPPLVEQSSVVRSMDALEERIVSSMDEVSKLRQYKSGLMHDLLTGRVRVPDSILKKAAAAT